MGRAYIPGWSKARKEAIDLANGLCDLCNIDIKASSQQIEVNHRRALVDGGHPTDQHNLQVLCPPCHRPHSAEVVRRNAKIARVKAKHEGTKKERKFKRKIQNRPMSKGYRPVDWKNRNRPIGERGKMR